MTPGDHATTPEWVLDRVRALGRIELDPCWNPSATTGAAATFDGGEHGDGLVRPWNAPGVVFVNPPYSRGQIAKWVAKAQAESAANPAMEVVMLIPCDPSTRWWAAAYGSADAVCFVSRRIKFGGHAQGAKGPSCVFYWGERVAAFAVAFREIGHVGLCPGIRGRGIGGQVAA